MHRPQYDFSPEHRRLYPNSTSIRLWKSLRDSLVDQTALIREALDRRFFDPEETFKACNCRESILDNHDRDCARRAVRRWLYLPPDFDHRSSLYTSQILHITSKHGVWVGMISRKRGWLAELTTELAEVLFS